MFTLNSGFKWDKDSDRHISQADQDLIDAYLAKNEVTECPPVSAQGNEVCPVTHERILEKRKEYRAAQRAKKMAK